MDLTALNDLTGGLNYVINLDERRDRMSRITEQFDRYHLDIKRISAIKGIDDPDIQNRLEHIKGYTPTGDSVRSDNIKDKSGKAGITRSQLNLIKQARADIEQLKREGKPVPKFIGMFEDDVNFDAAENAESMLKQAANKLKHIPDDAAMVYLGGNQRTQDGYMPIKRNHTPDGYNEISSSFSTFAALINTDFLPILEKVVEANTQTKANLETGIGGEEPIDMVYAMLHAYLALGERPTRQSGAQFLIDAFEEAKQAMHLDYRPRIYGINPLIAGDLSGQAEGKSDIYTDIEPDYRELLRTGIETQPVSHQEALKIRAAVKHINEWLTTLPKEEAKAKKKEIRAHIAGFNTKQKGALPSADALIDYLQSQVPTIQIAHVIPNLKPGGVAQSLCEVIRHSHTIDPQIQHVIITGKKGHCSDQYEEDLIASGATIIHSNMDIEHSTIDSELTHNVQELFAQHPELKPDVIQNWLQRSAPYADALAAHHAAARVSVISNARKPAELKSDRRRGHVSYAAAHASLIDRAITLSEPVKDLMFASWPQGYQYPKNTPVEVIYEGVDIERFKPDDTIRSQGRKELSIPDNAPVFGCVSRLHPMKDIKGFLLAAAEIKKKHPNAHFIIIGDGLSEEQALDTEPASRTANTALAFYVKEVERLTGINLLDGSMHFMGHQRNGQLVKWFNAMDVHMSTSKSEAFGRTLIESKACGVPNIVTDVGPMPSIAGPNGRVIPLRPEIEPPNMKHGIDDTMRNWAENVAIQADSLLQDLDARKDQIRWQESQTVQRQFTLDGMAAQYTNTARSAHIHYLQKQKTKEKPDTLIKDAIHLDGVSIPKKVPAVLFDFDETLHDTSGVGPAFYKELFARLDDEGFKRVNDMPLAEKGELSPAEFVRLIYQDDAAVKLTEQIESNIFKHIESASKPMEGAGATLHALAQKNIRLGIVSNQPDHVIRENVRRLFPKSLYPNIHIVGVKDGEQGKPDPTTIKRALSEMKLEPNENILYVGDNFGKDVGAAKAAGLTPVLFGSMHGMPKVSGITNPKTHEQLQAIIEQMDANKHNDLEV